MAGSQSPGYPQFALPKAITGVRKIFAADRRSVIDREVAQKHIGYAGQSGAADKALATLLHFGLLEKAGKGQVRVTQQAVDIIHPENEDARRSALAQAAFSPQIYKDLRERFGDHVSQTALHSYLVRENFLDRAINPVSNGYLETVRFLEQEKAFESGGESVESGQESEAHPDEASVPMQDSMIQERPANKLTPAAIAAAAEALGGTALNRINMNIQGDKVHLNGLLDLKGLEALESKISALKLLLSMNYGAEETEESTDAG